MGCIKADHIANKLKTIHNAQQQHLVLAKKLRKAQSKWETWDKQQNMANARDCNVQRFFHKIEKKNNIGKSWKLNEKKKVKRKICISKKTYIFGLDNPEKTQWILSITIFVIVIADCEFGKYFNSLIEQSICALVFGLFEFKMKLYGKCVWNCIESYPLKWWIREKEVFISCLNRISTSKTFLFVSHCPKSVDIRYTECWMLNVGCVYNCVDQNKNIKFVYWQH